MCSESVQEKDLIEAVQSGDQGAFEAIVHLHHGSVYGYLRSRLIDPADAEDLCQDTFLRFFQSRARFDSSIMIRPWLIGIARNVLREHVRKLKHRKEVAWTELCLELDSLVKPEESEDDAALKYLPFCLRSLGQSAREALDFRYKKKMRLAQIGQLLGRTEGAIKLLMYRARQALRHCISGKINGNQDDERTAD